MNKGETHRPLVLFLYRPLALFFKRFRLSLAICSWRRFFRSSAFLFCSALSLGEIFEDPKVSGTIGSSLFKTLSFGRDKLVATATDKGMLITKPSPHIPKKNFIYFLSSISVSPSSFKNYFLNDIGFSQKF